MPDLGATRRRWHADGGYDRHISVDCRKDSACPGTPTGTRRPLGKPVATIESGKWAGPVPNVFDCVIESANEDVLEDPNLLNIEPYEAWIARVRPVASVDAALKKLSTGDVAFELYRQRCLRDDIHCERGMR
jgi:glycine cleavage system H protein